jgi:hypothetical protein
MNTLALDRFSGLSNSWSSLIPYGVEPVFYDPKVHDDLLVAAKIGLPFGPIKDTDGIWVCQNCGGRSKMTAAITTRVDQLGSSQEHQATGFVPASRTSCKNMTMISEVFQERLRESYSSGFSATNYAGPLRVEKISKNEWLDSRTYGRPDRSTVLSTKPGICGASTWEWSLAKPAMEQIKWLSVLRYLAAATEVAESGNENILTFTYDFPDDWLPKEKLALLTQHKRMVQLELSVQELINRQNEIIDRMQAAGMCLGATY